MKQLGLELLQKMLLEKVLMIRRGKNNRNKVVYCLTWWLRKKLTKMLIEDQMTIWRIHRAYRFLLLLKYFQARTNLRIKLWPTNKNIHKRIRKAFNDNNLILKAKHFSLQRISIQETFKYQSCLRIFSHYNHVNNRINYSTLCKYTN